MAVPLLSCTENKVADLFAYEFYMSPCLHTFQVIDFRLHLALRIYPSTLQDENARGVNVLQSNVYTTPLKAKPVPAKHPDATKLYV